MAPEPSNGPILERSGAESSCVRRTSCSDQVATHYAERMHGESIRRSEQVSRGLANRKSARKDRPLPHCPPTGAARAVDSVGASRSQDDLAAESLRVRICGSFWCCGDFRRSPNPRAFSATCKGQSGPQSQLHHGCTRRESCRESCPLSGSYLRYSQCQRTCPRCGCASLARTAPCTPCRSHES